MAQQFSNCFWNWVLRKSNLRCRLSVESEQTYLRLRNDWTRLAAKQLFCIYSMTSDLLLPVKPKSAVYSYQEDIFGRFIHSPVVCGPFPPHFWSTSSQTAVYRSLLIADKHPFPPLCLTPPTTHLQYVQWCSRHPPSTYELCQQLALCHKKLLAALNPFHLGLAVGPPLTHTQAQSLPSSYLQCTHNCRVVGGPQSAGSLSAFLILHSEMMMMTLSEFLQPYSCNILEMFDSQFVRKSREFLHVLIVASLRWKDES